MIRVGIGYDVHAFAAGRRLVLGGVEIPSERGLIGHSDADVLLHAVMDALLGAAGLGDIGVRFPPSDPQWRDADSRVLLADVGAAIAADFEIVHIDTTVVAEQPKIGPHRTAIQAAIAETLGIEPTRVNVKASTNERMGFVGREEGIAALAVATIMARGGSS